MLVNVVELELRKKYSIDIAGTEEGYVFGIETAHKIFESELAKCNVEKIGVIFVDSSNKIINYANIAIGSIDSVKLPVAELFKIALLSNASKFIIAHNHPSGVCDISVPDVELTRKIAQIAKIFDMSLIDSVVINYDGDIKSIREHMREIQ